MKLGFLWLLLQTFFNSTISAAAPIYPQCFNYETFQHEPVVVPPNAALTNYNFANVLANHAVIAAVLPPPALPPGLAVLPVQINLGLFNVAPLGWVGAMPLGGPAAITLARINRIIIRRMTLGVPIAPGLHQKLNNANIAGNITPALINSLRAGGYLSLVNLILDQLAFNIFPIATILGVPIDGFIPDSVIVHIAVPRRVSKNVRELSLHSLQTGQNFTIKDRINAPYILINIQPPDSATVISSDNLQEVEQ